VLQDKKYTGTEIRLEVASFLQYAMEAPPSAPKLPYVDESDKTIVEDAIDSVPDLEKGQIDSVQPGVDILFHHASRALQVRLMRKQSGAIVRYNDNKTVDYLRPSKARRDRTNITISPANQNITEATPKTKGGDRTKTHLRMIGGGGVSTDVVADSYSDGDRQRWGRAQFKEVANVITLERFGKLLLEDLANTWLEVNARLTEIDDVQLQDKFTVHYPEKGIDNRELRVAEVTEVRNTEGTHYNVTLSSRTFARDHDIEQQQRQVSEASRTGQTSAQINTPQLNFGGTVNLPGDKFIDQRLTLPPKQNFYLWSAEINPYNVNIDFRVVENPTDNLGEGTVHYQQDNVGIARGNPLVVVEGKQSQASFIAMRLHNTQSTRFATGAAIAYTIESQ
jgi:hypothetical protein